MATRAPFVVPALKKHTATVIMAHGLGDSGAGWMGLAQNWRRRGLFEEVTFIFPNAPMIPITVNFGMSMPGWYDLSKLGRDLDFEEAIRSQDEPGILRSREYFNTLIKEQIDQGISPSRIVLGGFSQGGAMSVFTGVTNKEKLGGVFGLSCYLLLSDRIKNQIPEDWPNKKTPFFLAHGTDDDIVKYEFGKTSSKLLQELGLENVQFNSYPDLGHSADPQEIEDLEKFLQQVIPAEGDGQASAGL
ncbi:Phospholipase/carboxylesterase/thioesterase [Aspergillus caelatus]|uniref:Acyl-protein thioesterase 1 n=2 Tax=Aspergillus subgen. Circumdati TaxID=2720871 RepID=A0A5N6ZNL6_9EURO|nr:Phospholipase/carboxylesterase/thioesterase [Aspergillus caelatus]KAE8359211.1 Phospholipase/carboxylesterase/thioesterase [Aspergillus caelatus]KAE8411767.1 Phospholipase/carboxylesterase/thioesterase [Aspergillus pseudocaelatus]